MASHQKPYNANTTPKLVLAVATAVTCFPICVAMAETPVSVALTDIDSGLTSPQGQYRWLDVADQVYSSSYQSAYDYTQASVQVDFFTNAQTLHGELTASNLKPHFAYQFKLVGVSDTASNERIGLTGRWWQQEWTGSDWNSGWNLNNKGDGSSPNPNDDIYFATRDIVDATSPTGRRYRYSAYLVFDYFITDASGNASLSFEAHSCYHVLWKTSQHARSAQDGPLKTTTFDVALPDPVSAYDVDYAETTQNVFGEWERLPVGGVTLPLGDYEGQLMLTEESFHGSGLAGGWAAAMGGQVTFRIGSPEIPTLSEWALVVLGLLVLSTGSLLAVRRCPGQRPVC